MTIRTVSHITDRILRNWLEPPDDRPVITKLTVAMDNSQTTATYDPNFITPEEIELVGPGTAIEIGREIAIVGGVNESTNQFTDLIRGASETPAYAHAVGTIVKISPTWPRQSIFEAIGDAITNLYPDLFRVYHEGPVSGAPAPVNANVGEISNVYRRDSSGFQSIPWKFLEFDPALGTPAIWYAGGGGIYYTGFGGFERPLHENQPLQDLGIQPEWEQLVIVGAMPYLIRPRDLNAITLESVSEALEQQGFPPGQGVDVGEAFTRWYEYLMARARRVLLNRYTDNIQFHSML